MLYVWLQPQLHSWRQPPFNSILNAIEFVALHQHTSLWVCTNFSKPDLEKQHIVCVIALLCFACRQPPAPHARTRDLSVPSDSFLLQSQHFPPSSWIHDTQVLRELSENNAFLYLFFYTSQRPPSRCSLCCIIDTVFLNVF